MTRWDPECHILDVGSKGLYLSFFAAFLAFHAHNKGCG